MNEDINLSADETTVRIPALDGFDLGGLLINERNPDRLETAVLINCGSGISAMRYRNFARFLGTAGISVLIYDYRGIGMSRPPRLRGFVAAHEDWAEFDCAGAIAWLRARYPGAELVGLGHSIGCLLFGGAPNVGDLGRFVFVCPHTGYNADYSRAFRLPMTLLWHAFMPALTRAVGYFPGRALGLGEDIPAGVARQWAARMTPEYRPGTGAGDGARVRSMFDRMASLDSSGLTISFSDDPFATEAGTQRLLSWYPLMRTERIRIRPMDVGLKTIGHFGFFRRSAERDLWPCVLEYLLRPTAEHAVDFGTGTG